MVNLIFEIFETSNALSYLIETTSSDLSLFFFKVNKKAKNMESIQSSTTPDPGHHMGK